MAKFEVGSFVVPNADAHGYMYTGRSMALGQVTEVRSGNERDIVVKILKNNDFPDKEGVKYPVSSRKFDALTEETLFDMMVRGNISESDYESNMKLINNT